MALLRITQNGQIEERVVPLFKKITTLGSSEDNDICLCDKNIAKTHASILATAQEHHIQVLERWKGLQINGKKAKKSVLRNNDTILIGDVKLIYCENEQPVQQACPDSNQTEPIVYQKLYEFSHRLLGKYDLNSLLDCLLDCAIEITGADKGFIVLTTEDKPQVAVARTFEQETIKDPERLLSDSIVNRTIKERESLIVADALNDEEFNASESVISLGLQSVMCVPLMDRGVVLGILYVGNDSVANQFNRNNLEHLTIVAAQASLILRNALLMNELRLDNLALRAQLEDQQFGNIIGSCDYMKTVFRRVDRVASTDISVLITGETGTGKELIAKEIHRRSPRAKGPFVTINCGAIPENLLESEFFGHVRGAFTGATTTRLGKFQSANNGTLFLDEIGEMAPNLQVKILRAIQEKTVTKVGDTKSEPVDIRILAATNKDLEEEVKSGGFREDLYYRLNVVSIHLPPLRDRGDDIMVIARYYLDKCCKEFNRKLKGFTFPVINAIKAYHWPGNIRQLENKIKRAVILAEKSLIGAEDLELEPELLQPVMPLNDAKEHFQRRYINEILARNNGNRAQAARDLQVDPRTIFRHLEKERELEDSTAKM